MGLRESVPLLALIWPYALALGSGMALMELFKYARKKGQGSSRRVRFAARGQPEDEDNYVFMDGGQDEGTGEEEEEERGQEGADNVPTPDEDDARQIPYSMPRLGEDEMVANSRDFYDLMNTRRSVRFFSADPVPFDVVGNIIRTAGTSPSGAHMEPWTYVVVSDSHVKRQIREIIEEEEEVNYTRRMGDKWVKDLARLQTNWKKPYLEEAPYILLVFKQTYSLRPNGEKQNHYYSEMSVCISVGLILAALTNVGLTTVTSTPMNAGPKLRTLLKRPVNEKVLLLLPIGYPAKDATVPNLQRKPLNKLMVHI